MTKYDHGEILEKRSTHYIPVMPLLDHEAPEAHHVQYVQYMHYVRSNHTVIYIKASMPL